MTLLAVQQWLDQHAPGSGGQNPVDEDGVIRFSFSQAELRGIGRRRQSRCGRKLGDPERKPLVDGIERRRCRGDWRCAAFRQLSKGEHKRWHQVRLVYGHPSIHTKQARVLRAAPFAESIPLEQDPAADLINRADNELRHRWADGPFAVGDDLAAKLDDVENVVL
ncbi:MAG: hypothetical protein ACREUU_09985 [Gammaproteobacteria bacterium]